jgi:hypothetical protein
MAGWHGVDTVTADTVEAVIPQIRHLTVEPDRTAKSAVPVGGRDIPLATFLRRCADAIESVQPDRPTPAQHGVDEAAFAATPPGCSDQEIRSQLSGTTHELMLVLWNRPPMPWSQLTGDYDAAREALRGPPVP